MFSAVQRLLFVCAVQDANVFATRPTGSLAQHDVSETAATSIESIDDANRVDLHDGAKDVTTFVSVNNCGDKLDPAPACEQLVRETLKNISCEKETELRTCMNGVLFSESGPGAECCAKGTEFDSFVVEQVNGTSLDDLNIDERTAVMFLDFQNDFITGSLAQPCWDSGFQGFMQAINKLVRFAGKKGATLIATKDLRPADHCSFSQQATCKNTKAPDPDTESSRPSSYVHEFPPHTIFTPVQGKGFVVPQAAPDTAYCSAEYMKGAPVERSICKDKKFIGAAFDPEFKKALSEVNKSQVEVVFKGFTKEYESFSAIPHYRASDIEKKKLSDAEKEEIKNTGSWALPEERARNCHGDWESDFCYPDKDMVTNPTNADNFRPIIQILQERGIDKMIIAGLLFDFSVKETAIFAMQALDAPDGWMAGFEAKSNGRDVSVTVLADLTRPAYDGKPGAPYTATLCDGEHDGSYCTEGGGTMSAYENVKSELDAIGISLVRTMPDECAPKKEKAMAFRQAVGHFMTLFVCAAFILFPGLL